MHKLYARTGLCHIKQDLDTTLTRDLNFHSLQQMLAYVCTDTYTQCIRYTCAPTLMDNETCKPMKVNA